MSKTSNVFIFLAGAVVGATASWLFMKTKYEKIIREDREEINSFKEEYSSFKHNNFEPKKFEPKKFETEDLSLKEHYERLTMNYTSDEEKEVKNMTKPYVISPDEFGENDYETHSFTYYADGVLTDDFDEVIEDIEHTVGTDSLTRFGEFEDDSVFVRDDEMKCDYEILLDERKYSEIK